MNAWLWKLYVHLVPGECPNRMLQILVRIFLQPTNNKNLTLTCDDTLVAIFTPCLHQLGQQHYYTSTLHKIFVLFITTLKHIGTALTRFDFLHCPYSLYITEIDNLGFCDSFWMFFPIIHLSYIYMLILHLKYFFSTLGTFSLTRHTLQIILYSLLLLNNNVVFVIL